MQEVREVLQGAKGKFTRSRRLCNVSERDGIMTPATMIGEGRLCAAACCMSCDAHLYSPDMPHGPAFKRACMHASPSSKGQPTLALLPLQPQAHPYVYHGYAGSSFDRPRGQKVLRLQRKQRRRHGEASGTENMRITLTPVVVILDLGDS